MLMLAKIVSTSFKKKVEETTVPKNPILTLKAETQALL